MPIHRTRPPAHAACPYTAPARQRTRHAHTPHPPATRPAPRARPHARAPHLPASARPVCPRPGRHPARARMHVHRTRPPAHAACPYTAPARQRTPSCPCTAPARDQADTPRTPACPCTAPARQRTPRVPATTPVARARPALAACITSVLACGPQFAMLTPRELNVQNTGVSTKILTPHLFLFSNYSSGHSLAVPGPRHAGNLSR
jgi:hypothetical protein